jgi:hypothetical protein
VNPPAQRNAHRFKGADAQRILSVQFVQFAESPGS